MERYLFWKLFLILHFFAVVFSTKAEEKIQTNLSLEEFFLLYGREGLEKKQGKKIKTNENINDLIAAPLASGELNNSLQTNLPIIINDYVREQIKYLSVKKRKFLIDSLKRAEPYTHEMKNIFIKYNLPPELAYLPVIESGFKNHAVSYKGAAGMWQFMPGTARWIGLKMNSWYDQRYDPIAACEHAAKYLKFLYETFDDWYLALSAYNYGGRNLKKSMARAKSSEYYDLIKKKTIPLETQHYVPRFIATLIIINNLEQYGLEFLEDQTEYAYFTLPFMSPAHLVAKYSSLSEKQLYTYNPSLRTAFIPHPDYGYKLRLPGENYSRLKQNLEQLKKQSYNNYIEYYVKSGDNLSTIAENYGIPVKIIMSVNRIRNSNRIWAGQKIYIPYTNKKTAVSTRQPVSDNSKKVVSYKVKAGETISHIALKFGISADTIIRLNNITNPAFIKAGQIIKVYL